MLLLAYKLSIIQMFLRGKTTAIDKKMKLRVKSKDDPKIKFKSVLTVLTMMPISMMLIMDGRETYFFKTDNCQSFLCYSETVENLGNSMSV